MLRFLIILAGIAPLVVARAQYTVQLIQNASLYAISDGFVGGTGNGHARIYQRDNLAFTDLHPSADFQSSIVFGMTDTQQVGYSRQAFTLYLRPYLWTSTAASGVNLLPGTSVDWQVMDTDGSHQVGYGYNQGRTYAGMWSSTVGSFVDLHGMNYNTRANALYGTRQVGDAQPNPGTPSKPALWSGTAASLQIVSTQGYYRGSLKDIHDEQLVGYVAGNGTNPNACLWNGLGTTMTYLHTIGTESILNGTNGNQQVGTVKFGEESTGAVWSGTPESLLQLDQFLPTTLYRSTATAISEDGTIVGSALDRTTGSSYGVIWSPVPEPSSFLVVLSLLLLGAFSRGFMSRISA